MKILYEDIFHWMKYIYEDILFIVAAHAVGITMTEDMIEAMMIETTTADHTEEEVEEEEDGELLKTGIRFTGMAGEDFKCT